MYDALKVDVNSKHRMAICRPAGALDEDFTVQLLRFLFAFEEICSDPFDRLLDLTQVTAVTLNSAAIRNYADARRVAAADLTPFRTAIVAPDGLARSAADLYASLMKGSKISVGVFGDLATAAEWLDAPVEIFRPQRAPRA